MKPTVLAAGLLFTAFAAAAHVGPHPEAGVTFDQHLAARVPAALAFTDAQGAIRTFGDALAHMPSILVLGYVRCRDLCALALPNAAQALDRAGLAPGRDYRAVFASIDAREGPTILREAALRVPTRDRAAWTFLGGNDASAHALARAVGFGYRYDADRDAFAHPEGLVVLTADGVVSRYLFGASFEPSDLRLALAEAGQGRTGRLSDRLLLLCYHFDPSTGRYTARILDAMRLLIVLCAAAAAWFAWRTLRSRRGGAA